MKYPGVDNISSNKESFFRSVGNLESGNQLGFGFMRKKGVLIDENKSIFPFYSCCYVIRGKGVYIDSLERKYPLAPGSLFQRFPGREHSTHLDPESDWAECYIDFGINIYQNFLKDMNLVDPEQPVVHIPEDPAIESDIWAMLKELESSSEGDLPDLLLRSLIILRSLLGKKRNLQQENSSSLIVERSCRDFSRNYGSRTDLRQYCREKGIGYETFRKHFKNFTGLSPIKYIIRKRIDMACHFLLMTDKSVARIADELGYASQFEFSSQFKEITGVPPVEYRRKK